MGCIYNASAMKNLIISPAMAAKLRDSHQVSVREVQQCFENKCGVYLEDTREDNRTDPPSLWFIAPTNKGRILKVIFVFRDAKVYLKSAYEAEPAAISVYDRNGK